MNRSPFFLLSNPVFYDQFLLSSCISKLLIIIFCYTYYYDHCPCNFLWYKQKIYIHCPKFSHKNKRNGKEEKSQHRKPSKWKKDILAKLN